MKDQRSFFVNILILLLCIAGSGLCIFLFWKDLNVTLARLGEQPLGTITFRYNTAQRHFVDRLIWDRLHNTSPLYNGDVIRTADMSEATITFAYGGDIVDLASNTLIQIFSDAKGLRIDFSGGGISVNTSPAGVHGSSGGSRGMVIKSGNKLLNVESGAVVRAASLHNGVLDLAVSKGTAVLESTQSGEGASTIEAGSSLVLNASGETLNVPRAVALSPSPGARFLSQSAEEIPVNFSWNNIDYPSGTLTRLEIASDRSFNRISFSKTSGGNALVFIMSEGTWFWRLYPATKEKPEDIPYSKITIIHSPVPTLISPAEGQTIQYHSVPPPLRFLWNSSPEASFYNLEVADNPSLQNCALKLLVEQDAGDQISVVTSALKEGVWYWRVTPVYSRDLVDTKEQSLSGGRKPSAIQSFVIKSGAPLTAPVPIAPVTNTMFNIEAPKRDFFFSWRKKSEAVSYTIRISPNSDMSSPIIERTLTDTYYRYGADETVLNAGTWYWTVRQTADNGDVSPDSAPRIFIAAQGDIALLRHTNQGPAQSLIVAAAPAVTESISAPELNKPKAFATTGNGSLVIKDGQPVNFSWKSKSDTLNFTFRLYGGAASQKPVLEKTVRGLNFSVNMDNYKNGAYTWTVQGAGPASTQSFSVTHLHPVILEFPRNGFEYNGLDAMRKPGTVRWSSQDLPVETQCIISKDARMANIVYRQSNVRSPITLPRLGAGDYYWIIKAKTADGVDISSPAPFRFRVLPIPLLPAPQNRKPADSYKITPEQIKVSRLLVFSWNRVEGANAYKLTIFPGNGLPRKTLKQTQLLKENTYTLDDIQVLGRGNFSWQIEALHIMEDGSIEQHGQLQENKFIIDIPVPQQIQTKDSGILYGK